MAYLDVPHRPVLKRAGRENKAGVGHLGTFKVPLKLGMREWVTEESGAPLDQIILLRQPGDQSVEVFAPEGDELDAGP